MKTILSAMLAVTLASAAGLAFAQAPAPNPQMPATPSMSQKGSDDMSKPAGVTRPAVAPKVAKRKTGTRPATKKTSAKKVSLKKARTTSRHASRKRAAKHSPTKRHASRKTKK